MSRKRPKLKLANSPLSLVLCQVRFSPLMAMADYIAKVQDQLRRSGYPLNESTSIRELQLGPAGAATRERVHWEFMAKDRRSSVVVTEGFVVLQTTAYDDFESFVEQLKTVVSTVDQTVGGLLVQRVGLRYVDAIVPQEGETWRAYVRPCLHGFESPLFEEDGVLRLHQTVAQTAVGTMLVRLHQNRDGAVLPPDLGTGALKAPVGKAKSGETTTLVDIDHFHLCDSEYDQSRFEDVAWKLKEASYEVFADHVVTEHALKVWE
jgi:uncharacterized protein (TIGR04255 family)